MPTTKLFVQCPQCKVKYTLGDTPAQYSNGAYIENVAGAPDWRRLLCPCSPNQPFKFPLREKTRVHLVSDEDIDRTHFPWKKRQDP